VNAAGLGKDDPFGRRQRAAESFMPRAASSDQDVPAARTAGEAPSEQRARETETPPPPPSKEVVGRVQLNARIPADQMRALKRYQHKHGVTVQALVDQMVTEYLGRRGLLPEDPTPR
jgi:hypothetical protein